MKIVDKILNGYKQVVFIDFEGSQHSQEIIAIGALKVTLDAKNFVKTVSKGFKVLVKINTPVGHIVTNLTGITDELLENEGVSFKEAMSRFKQYVGDSQVKFIEYGNFDMHLLHNSAVNNELNDDLFIRYIYEHNIDFSQVVHRFIRNKSNTYISQNDALKILNRNIEGTKHDPLDDCINLKNLYDAFLKEKNIVKEQYMNVLRHTNLPTPFVKILKKIEAEQKVTLKDYETYIEEDIR